MKTDELISLYRECFPYDLRDEYTINSVFSDKTSDILTKEDENGRIIASAVVHKDAVYMLAVSKNHRGCGIGSSLLEECEKIVVNNGYDKIRIGVGDTYLMPGVPTNVQPYSQKLGKEDLYPELNNSAVEFFKKRGYIHSYGESNCFDMHMKLKDFDTEKCGVDMPCTIDGIVYRVAGVSDIAKITDCTDDAEANFTQYYRNESMYAEGCDADEIVIGAFSGDIAAGALIVSRESASLGSIGCTSVRNDFRGRKIATRMVTLGVKTLCGRGLTDAFLGYTYSGLDKLYGAAGFEICVYYFMAEKVLK